jgi:hypothetical protein
MPTTSSSDRFSELFGLLREATDNGTIRWNETAEEDTFRAILEAGIVHLSPNGLGGHVLKVFDRRSDLAGTLTPTSPRDIEELARFYDRIRHGTVNFDETYNALLDELRNRTKKGPSDGPRPR